VERLAAFGIQFGLAFQIVDDCLDLTGETRRLGKSILTDLDKGALSLPIIYLTQTLPPRERDRLFAPLRERATDPAFLSRVAHAAKASGAIAQARVRAEALMQQGLAALEGIPLNGLQASYERLGRYAVSRRS
jgi:octaprenyl-diphosphate synthase